MKEGTFNFQGVPEVDGNEDEDEFDDLENEFDYNSNERRDPQHIAAASLSAHLNIGRSASGITIPSELDSSAIALKISLLTYGQEVCTDISFVRQRFCYSLKEFYGNSKQFLVKKWTPRVEGDEDEDEFKDLENEFDYNSNESRDRQQIAAAFLSTHLNIGRSASRVATPPEFDSSVIASEIPLL
ncbi:cellulose synthase A catalytic subunit 5 [UDP-forming]-like [Olea europaea subsp. europaea]|uniref:Cellulose synthase A catalytic subunit 5 [UDP-forming]-like n=1 Tax=Olea europaea subsp. europaea TaxID=158383 RepID=A0A8S0VKC6_OLEEU|nr:cellulose synthase A catalytic subunit 5 [UDP-forming]-like [Olea europaea subsp. europaea]